MTAHTSSDPLLDTLLANRGITTAEDKEKFLNPDYERDVYDPFLMKNMDRVVKRIFDAIKKEEQIVIFGDYDCDGIPGSVVLHDLFKKLGYEHFDVYIPHRHDEGYGLNNEAIDQFIQNGVKVLITVDCGISDVDPVARAQKGGIDVIVTDHHLPQEVLPPAYAILNPKQEGDSYPDDMIAGGGVAFKLAQALLIYGREHNLVDIAEGWEKWLLDMAGLSTVADMVPLVNENRALAYFGLKVLQKSRRLGLVRLLKKIKVNQAHITEDDIGFMIAPRINAASRMDHPIEAFRLLATGDEHKADELADHLEKINNTRKGLVASIVKEARAKIEAREEEHTQEKILVVGSTKWQPGVLGLVANRLMEDYERPAFVWGRGSAPHIKGSCRSNGSVNVVELMTSVSDGVFLDVGGHAVSGGFSVSHEQIHVLEKELLLSYEKVTQTDTVRTTLAVDAELSLDDVSWSTYSQIERLAPFGVGNPKPLFLFKGVTIDQVSHFGKEKNHLRLTFKNSRGAPVEAIGFFMTVASFNDIDLENGKTIDLFAYIEKSVFRGRPELRLRIERVEKVDG